MSRDAYSELRGEYRRLVPTTRRRQHLVLLSQGDGQPKVRAVVGPSQAAALEPLIQRFKENGLMLRIATGEDGLLDPGMLWNIGKDVR